MNGTGGAILRLDEIDSAAIQMGLSPRQRILLRESHACSYRDDELGQVLRIVRLNHLVKAVILFASQKAETADSLTTVTNLTCGIYGGFVVVNTLAIAE